MPGSGEAAERDVQAASGVNPARVPETGPEPVLCLMGPTGTGKSGVALALAERLPVEIVSVDSAMIYRGMDVGTDKPPAAARAAVPHHLIDIRDPVEPYSAGEFARDAQAAIAAIRTRGRLPVLVGGTLLYFRALTEGLAPLPQADRGVREAIREQASKRGWPALHAELARADAATAARIHVHDRQRIERALEILKVTGRAPSELRGAGAPAQRGGFLRIALWPPDRAAHRARLAERFHSMLGRGLVQEVRELHARTELDRQSPAVRALGYRQLWAWIEGDCAFEDAVGRAIVATQRYAKRQMTWLRSEAAVLRVAAGPGASERVLQSAVSRLFRRT